MAKIGTLRDVPIEELHPAEENPRRISETRFASLRRAIREAPEMMRARPVIATPDGAIVAGEMRWRAAAAEEWPTVPALDVEFESLEEEREWRLRDNNGYGEWVEQELAQMLYELEQAGRDLELTGFSREETTKLIDTVAGTKGHNWPDDPAPNPPDKPRSKKGQVYKLGPHRLMCGDATNPKHVARLLGEVKPRLIATDPPYGVQLERDGKQAMENDDRIDWSQAFELVPSVDVLYVWHASFFGIEVGLGLERIGFAIAQQIVWDKMAFALGRSDYQWRHETAMYAARVGAETPWYGPVCDVAWYAKKPGRPWLGDRTQQTIWSAPSPKRRLEGSEDEVDHPTQKPTLLWTTPIRNITWREARRCTSPSPAAARR
jgi:hypothetical protein